MASNNLDTGDQSTATESIQESLPDRMLQYSLIGASAVASYIFFKYGANGGYGDEIGASFAGLSAVVGTQRILNTPRVRVAISRLDKSHEVGNEE